MTQPDALALLHPPFALTVRAGDLTLRVLRDADLEEYTALLRQPIFEDPQSDQVFPWYAVDPETRVREAVRFQWRLRAQLRAEDWSLPLGVWAGDEMIGCQDLAATDFAVRRTVSSGSWLTLDQHGRGYGKLMRQAMLVLAFDHLGAVRAESSAVLGNDRSFGVSRACGYVDNGTQVTAEGGRALTQQRFVVTPATVVLPAVEVEVEGVGPELRALLGA